MDKEEIKSGFLQVPPSWLQHLLNKPWIRKQCVLYPASRQGVKRLEVFDLAPSLRRKEPAALIIPLTDCVKIAEERHKGRDFVFSVVTREASHMFGALSIHELREWVDALQRIAFGQLETADCPSLLAAAESLQRELCDDNALYGSTAESRSVFPVTVEQNDTTSRLQLCGLHLVQITATHVKLRAVSDRRLRASWLFSHIRRYGQARGGFIMEVGRSSETGPGSFVFRTSEAAELQQELLRAMGAYEVNRHSATADLPAAPPSQPPPPPPPPPPLETQTLDRPSSARKGKKAAVAKPPRRTKAAAATAAVAEDLPNVVPLVEKQWLLTQSLKLSPAADEPLYSNEAVFDSFSSPYVNEPDEMVYAEPEERQSAWRELGRSVEHVEHVVRRRSALSDTWEAAALVEPSRPAPGAAGSRTSSSYACLQHMPRSTEPPGELYARLGIGVGSAQDRIAAWAADQSKRQQQAASAAEQSAAPDEQPLYENLPSGAGSEVSSQQGGVAHMLVNEDMYTLLDKPLKNASS